MLLTEPGAFYFSLIRLAQTGTEHQPLVSLLAEQFTSKSLAEVLLCLAGNGTDSEKKIALRYLNERLEGQKEAKCWAGYARTLMYMPPKEIAGQLENPEVTKNLPELERQILQSQCDWVELLEQFKTLEFISALEKLKMYPPLIQVTLWSTCLSSKLNTALLAPLLSKNASQVSHLFDALYLLSIPRNLISESFSDAFFTRVVLRDASSIEAFIQGCQRMEFQFSKLLLSFASRFDEVGLSTFDYALLEGHTSIVELVMESWRALRLPLAPLENILKLAKPPGFSGLDWALQKGYSGTVIVFLKSLETLGLDKQKLEEYLIDPDTKNLPRILSALKYGSARPVDTFLTVWKALQFPFPDQLLKSLVVPDPQGQSCLDYAIERNHQPTLQAFVTNCVSSSDMSTPFLVRVIISGVENDSSDLSSVEAFIEACQALQFVPVLSEKNIENLRSCFQKVFEKQLSTYVKVLLKLWESLELPVEPVLTTLQAEDSTGCSDLDHALKTGESSRVEIFMEAYKTLELSKYFPRQLPGLCFALIRGYSTTVEALFSGLKALSLSHKHLGQVLSFQNSEMLCRALLFTNTQTVQAFFDGLQALALPFENLKKLFLIGEINWRSQLDRSINDPHTVEAFKNGWKNLGLSPELLEPGRPIPPAAIVFQRFTTPQTKGPNETTKECA